VAGRKGGSNDGGSGRDGDGSSALFNLVIDPGDERSQVGVLHVVGEDKPGNPYRTREVLGRSKVIALSIDDDGVPVWSRTSGRSGSCVFGNRGSAFKRELARSNRSTVDEPVTGLPIALVTANSGWVYHCDGIVPIEGDARVGGSQRELRRVRNLIFRYDLTRSDASKTLEVGGEDRSGLEHWDGDRDELCVLEMGFDGFQLELGGLSKSDREEGASNEEGAESHWERKWRKWK